MDCVEGLMELKERLVLVALLETVTPIAAKVMRAKPGIE